MEITQKYIDELTYRIIGRAIEVHKHIGSGLIIILSLLVAVYSANSQSETLPNKIASPFNNCGDIKPNSTDVLMLREKFRINSYIGSLKILETKYLVDSVITIEENGDTICKKFVYNDSEELISEFRRIKVSDQWINQYISTIYYDTDGNRDSLNWKAWDSTNWINSFAIKYSYDDNGNKTSEDWMLYENSEWEYVWRYLFEYDSLSNLVKEVSKIGYEGEWYNYEMRQYTFNNQSELIGELWQYWSGTQNQWKNDEKYSYSYLQNGLLAFKNRETWFGQIGDWTKSERYYYTYSSNWNLILYEIQRYVQGSWQNYSMYEYTYDNIGKLVEEIQYKWYTEGWQNFKYISLNYDDNGNLISEFVQRWINGDWMNRNKKEYANNYDNKVFECKSYGWIDNNWMPENQFITININDQELLTPDFLSGIEVYCNESSPSSDKSVYATKVDRFEIWPNPASKRIIISYNGNQNIPISINIFSISGKFITKLILNNALNGQTNFEINISNIPSGLYLIQLSNKDIIEVEKLIIK